MTMYVTDQMAKGGIVDLDLMEINGKDKDLFDDTNIGLLINAPRSHVRIKKLIVKNVWKGFEFRAAKSIDVDEIIVEEFGNDGGHFNTSNIHVGSFETKSKVKKEYSDKNHPDILQVFARVPGTVMRNIKVDSLEAHIRGCSKHGGIHLTENNVYDLMFIGQDKLSIDMLAPDYPYWFSATNLSNSIIGSKDLSIKERGVRVKDVKRSGIISHNITFVGVDEKTVELDDGVNAEFYKEFPRDQLEKLLADHHLNVRKGNVHDNSDLESLLRGAEAEFKRLGL